jgi:hypothetical protein
MMNVNVIVETVQIHGPGIALIFLGGALIWRGLHGGESGEQGLLRRGAAMLGRIEGFRLVVFGLALVGIGFAMIWQAQWLLVLSIGIAVVEILESSALIAVWKWDLGRDPADQASSNAAANPRLNA